MSLRIEFAAWWDADMNLRTARYHEVAGPEVAERFVNAVEATVRTLADNPHVGRQPYPDDPHVSEFHSWLVEAPFHKHIVFYRFNSDVLSLERLIHGARDLPRRIHMAPYDEEKE